MLWYETQYVQDNQEGDRHNNPLINGRETQTQGICRVDGYFFLFTIFYFY